MGVVFDYLYMYQTDRHTANLISVANTIEKTKLKKKQANP